MQLITIAAMLFAAGAVIFALQNDIPVTVSFLLWHFDSSLAIVLLLALAGGGFIVALISTPGTLRRQWTIGRLKRQIAELEKHRALQPPADADVAQPAARPHGNTT